VGNDRVARNLLQRQLLRAQNGVAPFRDDAARDGEAGQHRKTGEGAHGFGPDGDIRLTGLDGFADLRGIALLQTEPYCRVAPDESLYDPRQHIPRIRVRRCDGEASLLAFEVIVADRSQVIDIVEYPLGDLDHFPPRLREAYHAIALALENRKADFRFQERDLLADAGLGSMQRFRRR
jgi:hypothetical protein